MSTPEKNNPLIELTITLIIPALILMMFGQRFVVQGPTMGAVK